MLFFGDEIVPPMPEVMVPGYEGAFIKMFLTLIGLLVAIFFTVWLLKRFSQGKIGGAGSSRSIRLLEKKPLSAKTMLYLLEIEGKQVMIAESQLEVKKLMTLEEVTEPEQEE